MKKISQMLLALAALIGIAGCATTSSSTTGRTAAQLNENPPPYWVGQRVSTPNHMTWGWIKRPEEPWSNARIIMLKEDRCLAPDRAMERRSADNNFQYRLYGSFWEHRSYDPVINKLFDVFVLERYEPIGAGEPLNLKTPSSEISSNTVISTRGTSVSGSQPRSQRSYDNID